ncbi:hypothetical protein JCM10213_003787 [Rhodosporidiobolus nylandii]
MPTLLDLPAELVDKIAEVVHQSHPKQYLGSAHRVFLASSRRLFFENLVVDGFDKVGTACKLFESASDLAQVVKGLVLKHSWLRDRAQTLTEDAARSFFRLLPSVRQLSVEGSEMLTEMVLAPQPDDILLPHLERLKVQDSREGYGGENPYAVSHFRGLARYQNLKHLHLFFLCDPEDSYRPALALPDVRLPLTSLKIEGFLRGNDEIPALIAACPDLESLDLYDETYETMNNLSHTLDAIPRPLQIKHLRLSQQQDPENEDDLSASLARFQNLSHLELGTQSFHPNAVPALAALPNLTHLTFRPNVNVSTTALKRLLEDGPNRAEKLVKLELDTMFKVLGAGWDSDTYQLTQTVLDERWTDEFLPEGVKEVIELAEKAGVEITGWPVEHVRRGGE